MAEKTEEPTPKKLDDARKKGNVAMSRDLSSVAVYLVGTQLVFVTGAATASAFAGLWHRVTGALGRGDVLLELPRPALSEALEAMLGAVLPLLLSTAAVGLAAAAGQVGLRITGEPLKPDLKKLNPLSKLKQWFGAKGLFEFLKSAVKIACVLGLGALAVRGKLGDILRLSLAGPEAVLAMIPGVVRPFLWSVGAVFALLAALDLFFQRWQWKKGLKMSKDEVKREFKDSEGDPEVKGQRKQVHQEMLRDVGRAVKRSAAVVVNPTHLAVALEYERGGPSAPRVAAKGRERLAKKIVALARSERVPVVKNVPVARALIDLEVDEPVPSELYEAVAEILLFAWKLREEAGR